MQHIERDWNGMPTFIESTIENGCVFENTLLSGFGTLIIDEEFINEMGLIANEVGSNKNLISLLTTIYNKISDYYNSSELNEKTRKEIYASNEGTVYDEDGMEIGTKISSLKGKNISECSEKSLAAYIILEKIFSSGGMKRKPVLVLSNMKTESTNIEPHAFVMLNNEQDSKMGHILFDVENLTLIEDKNGKQNTVVGLYLLTNEEYDNFANGLDCTPISLYETIGDYYEVGDKRTYGNIKPIVK